jgi:hypothetical protein
MPAVRTVAEPAKVMDGHVQDTKPSVRGRYRQTHSDPLRTYADAGQIDEPQLEAARWYESRFQAVYASGRDSTDLGTQCGSLGSTTPLSQYQAVSLREIIAVDSRLSGDNRRIVRLICGESRPATESVQTVTGELSPHYPIPRFREALNKLGAAIQKARKEHWTVVMTRVK